jgi:hypothetical protein
MFGLDLGDPETLWLNITNIALGAVTVVCFAIVGWGAAVEVLGRLRRRWALFMGEDEHIFAVPGLGTTMADGGEKVKGKREQDK